MNVKLKNSILQQRVIRVFVSSIFQDMQEEREELVKRIFPELHKLCESRKVTWGEVDLRWGVTEADATAHKNVVKVSLNRIDECRPFFVCFLGQRYGSIPRKNDILPETFENYPGIDWRENLPEVKESTKANSQHF